MITQQILKEYVNYEPTTGIFTWIKAPYRNKHRLVGKVIGSPTVKGYLRTKLFGKEYRMHNLAWLYVNGYLPINELDHVDRDKQNNKITNLRASTRAENARNKGVNVRNKSGFKGVRVKNNGRFEAQLKVDGKMLYLGTYDTIEKAHEAYCNAATKYHGEYACFN